ncbi:MAG: hypothetical protein LUD17_15015 [Bacteroidales bacterium]|nr:hypothetical protein [Bacteroidales bacterium]
MKVLNKIFGILALVTVVSLASCRDLSDDFPNNWPTVATWSQTDGTANHPFIIYGVVNDGKQSYSNYTEAYFLLASDSLLSNAQRLEAEYEEYTYTSNKKTYTGYRFVAYPNLSYDTQYYYCLALVNGDMTIRGNVRPYYKETPLPESLPLTLGNITYTAYGEETQDYKSYADWFMADLYTTDGKTTNGAFECWYSNGWQCPENVTLSQTDQVLVCWDGGLEVSNGTATVYADITGRGLYGVSNVVNIQNTEASVDMTSPYAQVNLHLFNPNEEYPEFSGEFGIWGKEIYNRGTLNLLSGEITNKLGAGNYVWNGVSGKSSAVMTYYLLPTDGIASTAYLTGGYGISGDGDSQWQDFSDIEFELPALEANHIYDVEVVLPEIEVQTTGTELKVNSVTMYYNDGTNYTPDGMWYGMLLNSDYIPVTGNYICLLPDFLESGVVWTATESDQETPVYLTEEDVYLFVWNPDTNIVYEPVFDPRAIISLDPNQSSVWESLYGIAQIEAGSVDVKLRSMYSLVELDFVNGTQRDITISSVSLTGESIYSRATYEYYGSFNFDQMHYIVDATFEPYNRYPYRFTVSAGQSNTYSGFYVIPAYAIDSDTRFTATDSEGNTYTLDIPDLKWYPSDRNTYAFELNEQEEEGVKLEIANVIIHNSHNAEINCNYGTLRCYLTDGNSEVTSEMFYITNNGNGWETSKDIYVKGDDVYLVVVGEEVDVYNYTYPFEAQTYGGLSVTTEYDRWVEFCSSIYGAYGRVDYINELVQDGPVSITVSKPFQSIEVIISDNTGIGGDIYIKSVSLASPTTYRAVQISDFQISGYDGKDDEPSCALSYNLNDSFATIHCYGLLGDFTDGYVVVVEFETPEGIFYKEIEGLYDKDGLMNCTGIITASDLP